MATITTVQTSSRRCSYCRENGHNIRSCEKRILQEKELMKSLRKKENENNFFDAIMLDEKGYICETSSANIFWIKDQIIYTPNNNCNMVHGTIRKALLDITDLKIKCGKYKISALKNADEVFITNSTLIILPIDKIAFRNKKDTNQIKYKKILVKKVIKLLKIRLGLI